MAYYLKYRPQTIDDLDLESVREDLTRVVKSGSIPHALLFAGPKGTGKTSAARILAKIVNCEKRKKDSTLPCNQCEQCRSITNSANIDVIEMDAASNRGIDDIRLLKDAVKLAPALAKSKIYIIDEAHMLTNEASNALLKTLEEPPSHVIFILATTNPEKLISTIRSRTHLIKFGKASLNEIVVSLEKIAKGENLKVDDGVLYEIARLSEGSFRDADKLLEQTAYGKKHISLADIGDLHVSDMFDVANFCLLLATKDTKKALGMVDEGLRQGMSAISIADKIIVYLRKELLGKIGIGESTNLDLGKKEIITLIKMCIHAKKDMAISFNEQIPLEVLIVEWCETNDNSDKEGEDNDTAGKTSSQPDIKVSKINAQVDTVNSEADPITISKTVVQVNSNNASEEKNGCVDGDGHEVANSITHELWSTILSEIRPINASTEALLRASRPLNFDGKTLNLGVYYTFHKEHLESINHRMLLENACAKVLGGQVHVVCSLTEAPVTEIANVSQIPSANASNNSFSNGSKTNLTGTLTNSDETDIINIAKDIFGD
ncbi:DNA polymerase III subunit gamma/tau [Candidatus Woesebacteria bacterium]|nr:MAG: DNA polymerase III subunit gamma/tau [Candidatus Woesebacteria bacterium]